MILISFMILSFSLLINAMQEQILDLNRKPDDQEPCPLKIIAEIYADIHDSKASDQQSKKIFGYRKSGKKPYSCELCGKKYTRPEGVKNHIWAVHLGKRFVCLFCPKKYSYLRDLSDHTKAKHSNLINNKNISS